MENSVLVGAKESVSFLHDVRSSVGVLLSNAEEMISRLPGNDFSAKLQRLKAKDHHLFTLYQSVDLLTQQLSLADYISNPDSLEFGKRSTSSLHPVFYKMTKLFEARAKLRRMGIELSGETKISVSTFQSFQLVPLILLDNAIKYGDKHSMIEVKFTEKTSHLHIDVESQGPVVPDCETELIFNRYERGSNAESSNSPGTGLGLYLANEICNAHGFRLAYHSDAMNKRNSFRVSVPRQEWVM